MPLKPLNWVLLKMGQAPKKILILWILVILTLPIVASEKYFCKEINGAERLMITATPVESPIIGHELCLTDLSYHKPIVMGCFKNKSSNLIYENKKIKVSEKSQLQKNGFFKLEYSHVFKDKLGTRAGHANMFGVDYQCTPLSSSPTLMSEF